MIARRMITDIEAIGDPGEIAVVPPLCAVAVSPYDFKRAGESIDRAAKSTRDGWTGTARVEGNSPPTSYPFA